MHALWRHGSALCVCARICVHVCGPAVQCNPVEIKGAAACWLGDYSATLSARTEPAERVAVCNTHRYTPHCFSWTQHCLPTGLLFLLLLFHPPLYLLQLSVILLLQHHPCVPLYSPTEYYRVLFPFTLALSFSLSLTHTHTHIALIGEPFLFTVLFNNIYLYVNSRLIANSRFSVNLSVILIMNLTEIKTAKLQTII